jgi:hypothetical protein
MYIKMKHVKLYEQFVNEDKFKGALADKAAVSVHKKLQDISIVNDAESVARGILIQTLYYVSDGESRKAGIETIINTLKKSLKDKDYLDRLND